MRTLLLVPTEMERSRLLRLGGFESELASFDTHGASGFGPIAAAARAAELFATLRPPRALLLGIAGTYDEDALPVGAAACFEEVVLDGVGAGDGERHVAPSALGFPQWQGPAGSGTEPIFERLPLASVAGARRSPLLVTACAAAATPGERDRRRTRFAGAAAEDMEGFGVALAGALTGVPVAVVRGISNPVGVRERDRWDVGGALSAARELALELLRAPEWEIRA